MAPAILAVARVAGITAGYACLWGAGIAALNRLADIPDRRHWAETHPATSAPPPQPAKAKRWTRWG